MSLNPPQDGNGNPFRVPNEYFIMERHNIEFQIKISGMGTLKGDGICILTTHRILLVNHNKNDKLKCFELPLHFMFGESFEQPIFGANYIKGKVKPLLPGMFSGDPEFKMWFMNGGCGKFLKSWRMILGKMRAIQQ